MDLKVEEISSVIKQEIAQFQAQLDVSQIGYVLEVGDGIARVYGLSRAMAGEMLDFGHDVYGQVFNLEQDSIGAVIYGNFRRIKEGDEVRGTGEPVLVLKRGKPVARLEPPAGGGERYPQDAVRGRIEVVGDVIGPVLDPGGRGVALRQHSPSASFWEPRSLVAPRPGLRP
jgi:F-type H+-transporting ATPase subunit alpha